MAYFANSTEAMMFAERYCNQCVHGQDPEHGEAACPINFIHFLWNNDQHEQHSKGDLNKAVARTKKEGLDMLIPDWEDGCNMFLKMNSELFVMKDQPKMF